MSTYRKYAGCTTEDCMTVHFEGRRYLARVRLGKRPYGDRGSFKTRAFVSGELVDQLNDDDTMTLRQKSAKMKTVLSQVFADRAEFKFSSKCGCTMCPCSPGFFVEGVHTAGRAFTVEFVAF